MSKLRDYIDNDGSNFFKKILSKVPKEVIDITEDAVENMGIDPESICICLETCSLVDYYEKYLQILKATVRVQMDKNINEMTSLDKVINGYNDLKTNFLNIEDRGYNLSKYISDIDIKLAELMKEYNELTTVVEYQRKNIDKIC